MPIDHRELWKLTRGQRLRYAAAIAALGLATCFTFAVPLVGKAAIDGLAPSAAGAVASATLPLATAAGLIVLLTALAASLQYLKGRWSADASEEMAKALRDRLYEQLQYAPCAYHDRVDTGDLVQRCTSDVETVRAFASQQVVEIGKIVLMMVTVVPIMWWMDPRMTVVSVAAFPLLLIGATLFFRRVRVLFESVDEAEGEMTVTIQENLTGVRVVRAFGRGEHERARFAEPCARYRDRSYRLIRLLALYWGCSDLLCVGQIGAVLLVGATRLASGDLSIGSFFAFMSYVGMLVFPVRQIGRVVAEAGKAVVSVGRISEVLFEGREPAVAGETGESDAGRAVEAPRGGIVVEGLSFAYADGPLVLNDVSFALAPGETVALLGPPGAGKSTLVHLLLGLYDYGHGSIRLDGRELRAVERDALRSRIGAVLQDAHMFSKTVRENLRLGREGATDAEVLESAHVADIDRDVRGFSDGYDTLVGERGVTLSGGQRQRIALARTVLRNPPVLVLDDALSAVDSGTEARILDAMARRHGRRTTLVIAHRLSTLARADRVLVLERGRIVQQGTHAELSRVDGPYQRLWRIQASLEDEVGAEQATAGGER